ncbi:TldD/PmbA family protein [candidate division WOR-3 bacterium]|nr:TldD/PmbA family protein [candidate division WOR-3 bacterium]
MFDEVRKRVEKAAAAYKVDDFEMLLSRGDVTSFDIEQRDITISSVVSNASLGLRLLKRGKLTYGMTTSFDQASLDKVVEAALSNLQTTRVSGFAKIPSGMSCEYVDSEIVRLLDKPRKMRDILTEMVASTFDAGKGKFERLNGGCSLNVAEEWVFTSRSQEPAYSSGSAFVVSVNLDSRDFELLALRKLPSSSKITSIGVKVARRLKKKNLKPSDVGIGGKKIDVVIHPMCLQSLIKTVVAEHIYASNKLTGLSGYRPGEKLASSKVTIFDDATHPELFTTSPTDQEGTPSTCNVLFDRGVFKTFIYDRETALLDGVSSTGNGMRRPVLAEDNHEAPVRPTLRGLVMEPGKTKLTDMMTGIKKGILLKYLLGIHTADKVSGAFTNTAYMSYIIENGKLTATTEPGTWAIKGNALEMLKDITQVSSERLGLGSSLLPWVKTSLYVG